MKNLVEILNKKYDTNIVKHKDIKKKWKKLCEHMEEVSIKVQGHEDIQYFQYEIIENSLKVKEQFEDVFFDTYVNMHDYWYDLTYQERKKQMNLEISKEKKQLASFRINEQDIFMPCFDSKFNHLYTDEIVLLDLKQYKTFIRTFSKLVQFDMYGVQPFLHGFSSAHVLAQKEDDFVIYHESVNRLYLYQHKKYVKALSLNPKKCANEDVVLSALAHQFLKDDEDALIDTILTCDYISKHVKKKIMNYKNKKEKRRLKIKKKEAKNKKQE